MRQSDERITTVKNKRRDRSVPSAELFYVWADAARKDEVLQARAGRAGNDISAVVGIHDPDFFIRVRVKSGRLSVRCMKSTSDNVSFSMDAALLDRILYGAQNLMIGLNKRRPEVRDGNNISGELLVTLINLQPDLSRIYRAAAGGVP